MTIENANKVRVLLDEKECLEEASARLSDFFRHKGGNRNSKPFALDGMGS